MALFQKKQPPISSTLPMYSLGLNPPLLIIGLGNPGKKYEGTRHNIGFVALDYFAQKQDFPSWIEKNDFKCVYTTHTLGEHRIILAKPLTYMNKSGEAVQLIQHFYKVAAANTLVVHDELDIEFGQIRSRMGGSSAGHNGIESISNSIGEEYVRLRIGIGPKQPEQMDSADFVLARFSPDNEKHFPALLRETNSLLTEFIYNKGQLAAETRSFIV